jgi:Protein of unknown function (DUF3563)
MRAHRLSMTDPAGLGVFPLIAKALMFPARQSDPIEHRPSDAAPALAKTPVPPRGLLERLEYWFWAQQQRDLEAYLARATDVYDLEARIHAVERNKSIPYY